MITLFKFIGFFLLGLVGYHYINEPLGFTIAGSIATVIFAFCLIFLYTPYHPDKRNWLGWLLITVGCLILGSFTSFSILLIIPMVLIVSGYHLSDLPLDKFALNKDADSLDTGGSDSFFDGGDGGGGD